MPFALGLPERGRHTWRVGIDVTEAAAPDVARWCATWRLVSDGAAFSTPSSVMAPVRADGVPAMLKLARITEEVLGNSVMAWWNGRGSAPVLRYQGEALLLKRAEGPGSLSLLAQAGGDSDDEASRILCTVAGQLHGVGASGEVGAEGMRAVAAPGAGVSGAGAFGADGVEGGSGTESARSAAGPPPPGLASLEEWFRDLLRRPLTGNAFYRRAASVARDLLEDQRDVVVLHGDIHHGNVLDFGSDGWRAIDPKGIVGDRGFDFANILCNPDGAVALRQGRLGRQVDVVADAAGLDRRRLLRWVVAWCGLSATWLELDDVSPGNTLEVGLAAERLLVATPGG
jgi:streptomycin 6-kinase